MWLPIDTAPKDGTVLLGCNHPKPNSMYYFPKAVFFGTYHPNAPGEKLWREAGSGHKVHLTHWMHLPDKPGSLGEKLVEVYNRIPDH